MLKGCVLRINFRMAMCQVALANIMECTNWGFALYILAKVLSGFEPPAGASTVK